MSKRLIIAEKPSVARDIAAALGGFRRTQDWHEREDLIITSGVGHLVEVHGDQVAAGIFDLDRLPVIPAPFQIRCIGDRKKQFELVRKLIQRPDVTGLINACDAGREGELIFRLIAALARNKKPVERMWLRSMTTASIKAAMAQLRPAAEYDALGAAAICRTEADWLIGINGSRAITALKPKGAARGMLSVGRVQSPTLALLVDRELAIQSFVPETYWEVHGRFSAAAGEYSGRWIAPALAALTHVEARQQPSAATPDPTEPPAQHRLPDAATAAAIVARCRQRDPDRIEEVCERLSRGAPKLFDLTTLQREANRRLKWSAKRSLDVAQKLYELKLITYPRTDCDVLPEDYVRKIGQICQQLTALPAYRDAASAIGERNWIRPSKRLFDNAKITDHFAIIPTGTLPQALPEAEQALYDLVVRRTLAAFFPPAIFERTLRNSWIGSDCFRSRGQVQIESGWMAVYGGGENDALLAQVAPNEQVRTQAIEAKTLKTKPLARYTEAALLSAMEHAGRQVEDEALREAMKARGLGTPATRAAIIENLLSGGRGNAREPYLKREGRAKHLMPTPLGIELIQRLRALGVDFLASAELTGEWECQLKDIEQGKLSRSAFIASISATTEQMVATLRQHKSNGNHGPSTAPGAATTQSQQPKAELATPCPTCAQPLVADTRAASCVCGFKLWRTVAGRVLSDQELVTLTQARRLDKLDGFTSKKGKAFSAALVLENAGNVRFEF